MQYGGSLYKRLQRELSNDRKKSEKSEKSATQVYFICSRLFNAKQTSTVCSMVEKKFRVALKSAISVIKAFYMQYGGSL